MEKVKPTYSLFVVTHKPVSLSLKKDEKLIVAGYDCNKWTANDYPNGTLFDNDGDNISQKNQYYSELTALYWIWKNCNEDIVGLEHYRRYFYLKYCKIGILYPNRKRINRILKKYDVVAVPFYSWYKGGDMSKIFSCYYKDYFSIAINTIREHYPNMNEALDCFLQSYTFYGANLLICKKAFFDEYCSWLFGFLSILENKYENSFFPVEKRIYGYISEYLMAVFFIYKKARIYDASFRIVRYNNTTGVLKNIIRRHLFTKNK